MRMLKIIMLLVLLITTLFTTIGCTFTTKISNVLADSAKYEGKVIAIKGTVGESIWLSAAEKGTYQIGDGSGTIWVITTQPPPQTGLSITTEGTVQSAFSILGSSYGTVVVETKRH